MTAITDQTAERLSYCEQTIALGKQTFLEVGNALAEIMEGQLYKSKGYGSFAEYCDKEWGFKKTYAYQLVNSAKAADSVSAIAENLNEAQSRALAKVPESKRVEVIEQAAKSGKVTAKSIAAAASQHSPKQTTDKTNSAAGDDMDSCAGLNGNSETGGDNLPEPTLVEIAAHVEPNVTEYYNRLERVMLDAIANATDKQLASMSVYAALMPKLIKDEQRRRAK